MTTSGAAPTIDGYIQSVLAHIPRTSPDRTRIADDVRVHLIERIEAGHSVGDAIAAMGNPMEVARSYLSGWTPDYAPLGRRFMAFVVDCIAAGIVIVALFGGFYALIVQSSSHLLEPRTLSLIGIGASLAFFFAAITIVPILYFPIAETIYGQTLGKRWLGIAVVTYEGFSIGAGAAFIRRIPYFFNALIVLDALFVFVGPTRQRAFDRIANTVVVRAG